MVKLTSPTGVIIQEPDVSYRRHEVLDGTTYLGDPATRYGRLTSNRKLTMGRKLEMLCDHRIALACSFLFAPLINAPWAIECGDPDKRAFFEAVWGPLHRSFMLQAVMAIPLGAIPLVKKLALQKPRATQEQEEQGVDPWPGAAEPVVVEGFDQIYPTEGAPAFDKDTGEFLGIELRNLSGDKPKVIGPDYALWLTRGLAEAFGDYAGMGRLMYVYRPWWDSMFSRDLRIRHIERTIDPPLKILHPPGGITDASDPTQITKRYSEIALEVGQAFRSGATVTLPSEPYISERTGELTGMRKWDITALEGLSQMGEFEIIRTQDDADIYTGMLIPPQALQYAKEALGGKSVVEVLGDTAVQMLILEWQNIADHVDEYVFDKLNSYNFPSGGASARLVTTGFREEDTGPLVEFLGAVARRVDVDVSWFDAPAAARELGWPVKEPPTGTEQAALSLARQDRPDPQAVADKWDKARMGLEDRVTRALTAYLREQAVVCVQRGAEVSGRLRLQGGEQLPLDLGDEFWASQQSALRIVLGPILGDVGMAGAQGGAELLFATMGVNVDWSLASPAVLAWVKAHTAELIVELTDNTKGIVEREMAQWIAEDIQDWVEAGEANPDLIARLVSRGLDPARARTIAVTEATRAYAEANREAWRQSGFVTGQRWMTAVDERVCLYCGALHTEVVSLDDSYRLAPDAEGKLVRVTDRRSSVALEVSAPPAHPNCRCYLQPFIEGWT